MLVFTSSFAQTTDEPPVKDYRGIRAYFSRTVKITGSLRVRWEGPHGSDFTVSPADFYLLTRARLGLSFQPAAWLRFVGEAQDAHALFYQVKPSGAVDNPIDLRAAYIQAGAIEDSGVELRVGRQDLTLGSGRLTGTLDWSNTSRTFDIVRASMATRPFKLDLVAGSIVLTDPNRVDRHRPGDHFYAVYAALPSLLPAASIEPYFIARTQMNVRGKSGQIGDADTLAAGTRLTGKTPGHFDYSIEAVRELGAYSDDTLRGFGFAGGIGWTAWNSGWAPRLSTEYIYASGDDGRKNGHRETFDNMYGFNQPTNSLTGQFGWRNLSEYRVGVNARPAKHLKVSVDFRDYSLASSQDGLYNASGTRTVFNAKATSTHAGCGADVQVVESISKTLAVGLGIGTLIPGEYLRQSGKTSGFVYPFLYVSRTF